MRLARKQDAFTLIEIMIVVVIIGIMATLVGPNIMKLLFGGRKSATQTTLQSLKTAMFDYQMDIGSFPQTLEGLVKNINNNPKWHSAYLENQTEVPKDAWGRDFIYNKPPKEFKDNPYKIYEIISYGEDENGEDKTKWLHTGG